MKYIKTLKLMVSDLINVVDYLDEKNKDAGTVDFLTAIMEQHESTAWILRRYLN